MIVINNFQIYSDIGKYIHRLGTETYFKRATILKNDSIDMFEEVDEIPKYTEDEYVKKVRELIAEKYSIEDELALHRKYLTQKSRDGEFEEYNLFVEDCKIRAKEILNEKDYEC